MNKAEIAKELNENCCWKNHNAFMEWSEYNVELDPEGIESTYCYHWPGESKLCWSCREILTRSSNLNSVADGEVKNLRAQVKELTDEILKIKAHLHLE